MMGGMPMPAENPMQEQQDGQGRIRRDTPKPDEARATLVKDWCKKVVAAKDHWKRPFARMREDMDFVSGKQWAGGGMDEDRYTANITQRHIAQRVAALYCKNPKATAKRKKRLEFSMWDGTSATLQQAQAMSAMSAQQGMPPDPQGMALIQDFTQGSQKRVMLDKVAKTMEILFQHVLHEQQPNFKAQMKQLVRRVCVTGVGFVKVGFERVTESRPEDSDKIRDITQQLSSIERITQDVEDGIIKPDAPETEQLKNMLHELNEKPEVLVREGVVFDFPPSTSIIVDPRCRHLSSFLGAAWVCQEFIMSPEAVKEVYKVDLGKTFTSYTENRNVGHHASSDNKDSCVVWEIYS